jgi:membrane-associated phospholipid phosphatase
MISLYAFKIKKAKALPILVFPIGVWFSAVYLGEHYVIDVIGGVVYGTCAFFIAEKLIPSIMQRVRKGAMFSNLKALRDCEP